MEMAGKHSDHYFCRWQAKIVTTIHFFFWKKRKNWKVLRIAWFGEKIYQKNIFKILPPSPPYFFCFVEKTRKVLRIAWFGEKVDQNCFFWKFDLPPPGFFRFFLGYSADKCTEKFPLTSMGGWAECPAMRTRERGPPWASAEILYKRFLVGCWIICTSVEFIYYWIKYRTGEVYI